VITLRAEQFKTLRAWFADEGPGDMAGQHVLNTGHGRVLVDRWPEPRVALATYGDGCTLRGNPSALQPSDVCPGFFDAPAAFEPVLREADAGLVFWERVYLVLRLGEETSPLRAPPGVMIRRLAAVDNSTLAGLSAESSWISHSWGGPAGLAGSEPAFGAFCDGRLASVACSFEIGDRFEDIGVVTEAGFRGRGLAGACAGQLCSEIFARGRVPSWSTGRENLPSLRVAEKLGFAPARAGILYAVNKALPEVAQPRPAGD
jgi:RimJ/RimL family protein N-acetyltransferase